MSPITTDNNNRAAAAVEELDTQIRLWCFEWGMTDYRNASSAYRARVNLYLRFGLHCLQCQQIDFDMALSIFYAVVERSSKMSGVLGDPILAAACIIYASALYNYTSAGAVDRQRIAKAFIRTITAEDIEANYRTVIEEYQSVFFLDVSIPKHKRRGLPSSSSSS